MGIEFIAQEMRNKIMPIKRDIVKQTLSYGWIVFLCCLCGITGTIIGWSIHRAMVNISGENLGFIQFSIKVFDNFENPYAWVMAIVSVGGLVLQAVRTFRNKRDGD